MALVAKVYDETYTSLLRTLTLVDDVACQPMLSEAGAGGFTLPLTAPDYAATLAAEQGDCAYRNIVRFEDGGTPVFAMVIRSKTVVRVDQQEESAQQIEYDGPGTMGLWAKAVWYPELGVELDGVGLPIPYDTRHLTFVSTLFDDSGWAGVDTADISTIEQDSPANYPDASAKKIRPGGSPVVDTDPEVFGVRSEFSTSGGDKVYRLFYTGDDGCEIWIDGVRIAGQVQPRMWQRTQEVDVRLRDGTHLLAIQGTNIDFPGDNFSWVIASLYELDDGGTTLSTVVVRTDDSWVGAQFGDTPPGFTPGEQARIFLDEAQARGALDGWSLGCTDTHDSDGIAWGAAPASSYQIGLDGLSFLEQLGEAFADVFADPSALVLDLWNFGTKGGVSGVTLTPGTNVGSMVNTGTV
jgi:hypothetical protein